MQRMERVKKMTRKKKLLDVTTKGWSEENIKNLNDKINDQNYRYEAKVITKKGEKKFCYFYTKVDLEIAAIQVGFKILNVKKL